MCILLKWQHLTLTTGKGAQETAIGKGAQEKATGERAQEKATGKGLSAAGGSEHSRKAGCCRRGKKRTRRTEGQEGYEFAQVVKEGVGGYRATGLSSSRDRRHLEADRFDKGGYASKASPEARGSGRVKRENCSPLWFGEGGYSGGGKGIANLYYLRITAVLV